MSDEQGVEVQHSLTSETISRVTSLSARVRSINERMSLLLHPILLPTTPCAVEEGRKIAKPRVRPPFFEELHASLDDLEDALIGLNGVIDVVSL